MLASFEEVPSCHWRGAQSKSERQCSCEQLVADFVAEFVVAFATMTILARPKAWSTLSRASPIDSLGRSFLDGQHPIAIQLRGEPRVQQSFATSLGTFRPLVSLFGVPV